MHFKCKIQGTLNLNRFKICKQVMLCYIDRQKLRGVFFVKFKKEKVNRVDSDQAKKSVVATGIGNAIEWFDFGLYLLQSYRGQIWTESCIIINNITYGSFNIDAWVTTNARSNRYMGANSITCSTYDSVIFNWWRVRWCDDLHSRIIAR